ncbi:MAG: ThuA domain-containing protein [Verrucomicrobiales bacterium]|nr:ThuA domain-containing protein [Verrucomicrobiales bacterium]
MMITTRFVRLLAGLVLVAAVPVRAGDPLKLHLRDRPAAHPNEPQVREATWDATQTAIVVCDMWNQHWCQGATARVAEMAPRMNEVLKAARAQGVLIIHCPSGTLDFYRDTPQRRLAQSASKVEPKVPLQGWCSLDRDHEGNLPIDDSDGGCDDWPQCRQGSPWSRQIATLEIAEGDAITDSAEAYYLMRQRGIRNVIVMGVHLNMCVLGRPFAIRQLVAQDLNVVLMRDMTDTMYNSRMAPYVSHFVGTDLMIRHVEEHWCPTTTSVDFLGGEPFRFRADRRKTVAFLIGENEYHTWETLPAFAESELAWRGYRVEMITSSTDPGDFTWQNWEALKAADLMVVSARRRATPKPMMALIRAKLAEGVGLVGIRTACHAFAVRGGARQKLEADAGLTEWADFDPEVLGGNYTGHHSNGLETTLSVAPGAAGNPMLTGVDPAGFPGHGSLYRVSPLKADTTALISGAIEGEPAEPVAWTRLYGPKQARVFYTSLGHPDDFKEAGFRRLLLNGVLWAMHERVPPVKGVAEN